MTQSPFHGGTAVITGAGSGLGASMVERFAAAGMNILALDIDGASAEDTAQKVRKDGGQAVAMRVDVANADELAAAARLAADRFGGCSVLCANVGVQQFGAIERLTEQDWQWVIDVNVMGVIRTVAAFLPLIRETSGERRIAITSSSGALMPGVRMAAYTASKYAVTGYSETLRMELAEEGIGVSTVFPAGMITRHLESSIKARPAELGPSELRQEDIEAMMASRDMDTTSHVATADHATRHLLADLAANERFIVTHGEYRQQLTDYCDAILRAHDRGQES
ncbi:MAG TPA: SDR family NAD(P)-dependent oxidoreductase [Sphingobium sp.]|uniref:SDR family NAD(P)-dependent oxidoreductase n=1 Tax=Sphingobium sp. TaxID=1912891 RepID=UPI002ED23C64